MRIETIYGTHEVILHGLNKRRQYQHETGKIENVCFPKRVFKGTESLWERVPVVLGKRHPITPFSVNPAAALEQTEGRIVGNLSEVRILADETLRGKLSVTDSKADDMIRSGEILLSSGFGSDMKGGAITGGKNGVVKPDHLLLFSRDSGLKPQDPYSRLIVNAAEDHAVTMQRIEASRARYEARVKADREAQEEASWSTFEELWNNRKQKFTVMIETE